MKYGIPNGKPRYGVYSPPGVDLRGVASSWMNKTVKDQRNGINLIAKCLWYDNPLKISYIDKKLFTFLQFNFFNMHEVIQSDFTGWFRTWSSWLHKQKYFSKSLILSKKVLQDCIACSSGWQCNTNCVSVLADFSIHREDHFCLCRIVRMKDIYHRHDHRKSNTAGKWISLQRSSTSFYCKRIPKLLRVAFKCTPIRHMHS